MTFGETARRVIFGLAALGCAASWVTLGSGLGARLAHSRSLSVRCSPPPSQRRLCSGSAPFVLGWTAFANRARLWKRLTGGMA
jgi:hypothetical protein